MLYTYRLQTVIIVLLLACPVLIVEAQHTLYKNQSAISQIHQPTDIDVRKPQIPGSSDLSEKQAIHKALHFLATLRLLQPSSILSTKLTYDPWLRRVWEINWPEYKVSLDSGTGKLVFFQNTQREHEQFKGINRHRSYLIQSNAQAQERLRYYAQLLGLPNQAQLVDFHAFGENDPHIADSNKAGAAYGTFTLPPPGGYLYHKEHAHGISISIDPLDGLIMVCRQEWRVYPTKPVVKLSQQQAIQMASTLYQERSRNHFVEGKKTNPIQFKGNPVARLEYVMERQTPLLVRGGYDYSMERLRTFPRKAYLAWVVIFNKEEIWLDAATGKQLGALIFD